MEYTFLVADDHPMVRAGVISLVRVYFPKSKFVEAETIYQAKCQLEKNHVDCALLDYKLGSEHVISLIPHIQQHFPEVRMLVISMMDANQVGASCLRAGAHGFLHKAAHPDEVHTAIKTVLGGRVYASIEVSRSMLNPTKMNSIDGLTKRELQVFSLVGEGLKVSQIAEKLGVSVKTIEAHREHIKNKLGIDTAAQLVIKASKWLDECVDHS